MLLKGGRRGRTSFLCGACSRAVCLLACRQLCCPMMRVHPPVCHALPAPFPQLHMQIDDPQDSTAVHFCAGIVGTLLNGMFAKPSYVSSLEGAQCGGFIYTSQGGRQLGMQLLGG